MDNGHENGSKLKILGFLADSIVKHHDTVLINLAVGEFQSSLLDNSTKKRNTWTHQKGIHFQDNVVNQVFYKKICG